MRLVFCFLCCLTVPHCLGAADIPPGGERVLPEDATLKMSLGGGGIAARSVVYVDHMPFARAVQGRTFGVATKTWDAQFSITTSAAIEKDDVLLAVFWARGIESSEETGEVYSEFILERNGDPWTKSASHPIVVVGNWKQFLVPFRCAETYGLGQAAVRFRLGYKPQTVQIGGLQLLNYGKDMEIADLPQSTIGYGGMELDAAWRVTAEEMIDRYRKGDIEIVVKDAQQEPVAGAEVRVQMTRHAYRFGSAVDARAMRGRNRDVSNYKQTIQTYFNRVVMENDLKWGPWESWDRQTTLDALDTLRGWGIEIRGHNLVWPSWKHLPGDLEQNQHDPQYLRSRVLEHIEDEAGTLAGRLVDWDVVNENYWNHDLMDILGEEVMVDWFHKAHEADPHARLYLNDNNIISGGGLDETHRNYFIDTVQFLLDNGAPIGGLGTQCHFGSNPTPPQRIWSILDELDDLGLEIQCTEFDISSDDSEYQVNYTRDFMTAYFAHPSTVGILMWGFWEGKHWRPKAALWDRDWNLRPHGQVWVELVTQTWWTDETLTTDPAGRASLRGFLGDYTVSIQYDGQTTQTDLSHRSGRTTVTATGSQLEVQHDTATDNRTQPGR